MYAKYLRQAGTTFSQGYIEQALIDNPAIAAAIVELFESRFDPARENEAAAGRRRDRPHRRHRGPARRRRQPRPGPHPALAAGRWSTRRCAPTPTAPTRPSRSADTAASGAPRSRSSSTRAASPSCPSRGRATRSGCTRRASRACTCASARSPAAGCAGRTGARTSAPRSSAWSRRRWSRTPSSCRPAPRAASSPSGCPTRPHDRDAWLAEGIACYRTFIACLLDVTDNYVDRRGRRAAASCRRRRCAATTATTRTSSSPPTRAPPPSATSPTASPSTTASGSATRSPAAARSATTTRRWASPPGARGSRSSTTSASWASTPRPQDFTVVGIGDMSGDVFGNGMLLSEHIRLVAAFDHRHVFLDPDPDRGDVVRRAAAAVRPAALVLGRLRPLADLRRRRRLPAHGEVDPDLAPGRGRARPPGGRRVA